jgi:hypothetical protein
MKSEKILDAFGQIDDDLIDGTENNVKVRRLQGTIAVRRIAMAACFLLVFTVGIISFDSNTNNTPGNDVTESPEMEEGIANVVVNGIVAEMPHGAIEYLDPKVYKEEEWTYEMTAEYFGYEFEKLMTGNGLDYELTSVDSEILRKDGELFLERTSLVYEDNSYETSSRVVLLVSRLTDDLGSVYELESGEASLIGDKEIFIGGILSDINSNVYELINSNFTKKGINYQVMAHNVDLYEFSLILDRLIR